MQVGLLEQYFERAVSRGERSSRTRDNYLRAVRQFEEWYAFPDEPDPQDVRDWLTELMYAEGLAGSTLNIKKCALAKYFTVTGRAADYVEVEKWFADEVTVSTKETTDYFEQDEMDAIRRAASEDPRDAAIVAIFGATGIRVSELVELDEDDIDLEEMEITVERRKRRDAPETKRPLSDADAVALRRYFSNRNRYGPSMAVKSPALFFSGRRGKAGWRVTDEYVRILMNRVAERTDHPNVTKERMHPHMFRHTVGATMAMNGFSAEQIAAFLGQKNSNSAQRYMHFNKEQYEDIRELLG